MDFWDLFACYFGLRWGERNAERKRIKAQEQAEKRADIALAQYISELKEREKREFHEEFEAFKLREGFKDRAEHEALEAFNAFKLREAFSLIAKATV